MFHMEDVELLDLMLLMKVTIYIELEKLCDILKECLVAWLCDVCIFILPFNPRQGL